MGETSVSGTDAARYKIIKLDDLCDAFQGELIAANTMDGSVSYKDKDGTVVQKNFGPHAIIIVPKR